MAKLLPCAAALALLAACGDARSVSGVQQSAGPGTHTTTSGCASAGLTGLTYASFAQGFFGTYCTRCHSASKTGADRNGAPGDHNFDTLGGIQQWADQIDQVAAMNPDGSVKNTFMPFDHNPDPDDLGRKKLACWIVAGLPQ